MPMTTCVQDKVVFITGVSKPNGIGRALLTEAVHRGARKIYATARDCAQLDDCVAAFPSIVVPVQLDVTNADAITQAARHASDTQILINNAGVCHTSGCLDNNAEAAARQEMDVNYFAPLRLIQAFANTIIENGSGAIVNIISIGGLYPSPFHVTYSAAKAALVSLTHALRIHMAMHGHALPVYAVYPGPVDTDMARTLAVVKASPDAVARRICDAMAQGIVDITTDALSDHFQAFLTKDTAAIEQVKQAFSSVA